MSSTKIVAIVLAVVLVVAGAATALVVGLTSGDSDSDSDTETAAPERASSETAEADEGATDPPSPELEPYYSQEIAWEACGGNECGTLTVPVDYGDPEGETIDLALEKAPASGERIGSMVVNPGGPGAPGTTVAEQADGYFGAPLLESFDVVGFDPRGTGESSPVDCLSDEELDAYIAADPAPDDAAEGREALQRQRDFFEGCVESSGDVVGHVSTVEAARDLDVLRAALGESELTYFGFSYGTELGSTYAELFPQQVGRFVLDGATDPTLSAREDSLSQARGFETALRAYVGNCVDSGDCFLGASVADGLATISALLDRIDQEPLPTDQEGRDLEIGNAFYGVILPLYSEQNWPVLDQGLQEALEEGTGSTLLFLSDTYGSREGGTYVDNSLEAISAINCLDDPYAISPAKVPGQFADFEKASPTFGRVFAWGLIGCRGIQVEAAEEPPTVRAEGAAPIVVIGTTRDPATPYEEAVALAEQLESGVLLSRDGDGHTAYNRGNDCIDEAVETYLIDGTAPEDGTEC